MDYFFLNQIPAAFYLFTVNNGNTITMCEICSKLDFEQVNTGWDHLSKSNGQNLYQRAQEVSHYIKMILF